MMLVGCFGFKGPLRQYFSLYRAVSQREGERGERIDESKNVQTTPTRTYCKRNRPLPYRNQNCRTPRHWKLTQHHRTTRPPPATYEIWLHLAQWFQRRSRLKVWTDDGRTTEACHTKSSPGAFGSGELKTHLALTVSNSLLQSYLVVSFAQPFVSTGIETSARQCECKIYLASESHGTLA